MCSALLLGMLVGLTPHFSKPIAAAANDRLSRRASLHIGPSPAYIQVVINAGWGGRAMSILMQFQAEAKTADRQNRDSFQSLVPRNISGTRT